MEQGATASGSPDGDDGDCGDDDDGQGAGMNFRVAGKDDWPLVDRPEYQRQRDQHSDDNQMPGTATRKQAAATHPAAIGRYYPTHTPGG